MRFRLNLSCLTVSVLGLMAVTMAALIVPFFIIDLYNDQIQFESVEKNKGYYSVMNKLLIIGKGISASKKDRSLDIWINQHSKRFSWRVAILPHIGEEELFKKFSTEEAWDSKANLALLDKMPAIYAHPTSDTKLGKTGFRGVMINGNLFSGKLTSSEKYLCHELMVVEHGGRVEWTRPDDFLDLERTSLGKYSSVRCDGFYGLLSEGDVMFFPFNLIRGK